jgi:hypothetical protein
MGKIVLKNSGEFKEKKAENELLKSLIYKGCSIGI